MSNKALNWAFDSGIPPGQRFVLVVLADHASDHKGEDWVAFPSVERIEEMTGQGEKTIRRHLDWLEAEGWLSRAKRRARGRLDAVYEYTLHRSRVDRPAVNLTGDQADSDDGPPVNLTGDTVQQPPVKLSTTTGQIVPTTGQIDRCTIDEPPRTPNEPRESARAPEVVFVEEDRSLFDAVAAEWGKVAPDRVSKPLDWPCWLAAMGRCEGGSVDLARAARRYLAESRDVRDRMTKAFGRWLRDDRWETWLALVDAPVQADVGRRFPDPLIRAAVVEARREAFAASYLDPADWDAEVGVITPRTATAGAKLNEIAHVLRRAGATVGEAKRVSGNGEVG